MLPSVEKLLTFLNHLRLRHLLPVDLFCIVAAFFLALTVRYEALIRTLPYAWENWPFLVLSLVVRLSCYYAFRLYHRLWRYASTQELNLIVLASVSCSLLLYIINFGLFPQLQIPHLESRSIWLLEGVFNIVLLGTTRFVLRFLLGYRHLRQRVLQRVKGASESRTLIVGAGDAGAAILREVGAKRNHGLHVVGLVDDDQAKHGLEIHSVRVLGDRHAIPALVQHYAIDQVIIAIPAAPGREIRQIVQICEGVGVRTRTIPGMHELLDGKVRLDQLRNVEIADLLRREAVTTDVAAVREVLHGKRVLITGAGGSIGSELSRQIFRLQPTELILLGHGENSIFEIQQELLREREKVRATRGECQVTITPVIADIRFGERLNQVFEQLRPEIVFHAAAHKHVPLMESNPSEAITNNLLGTRNVLEASLASGVDRFVMISSDKAVNPTSVMGATKRAAELLVLDAAKRSGKHYAAVRFGNVLGSRGSVVLTFKRQIAAGGPITITDPEMKRFFMTIPEAVQLVLQTAVLAQGGEVFMLDMGEQIKIVDLARDLITLSGLEVGRDIDIVYTGLRPGEKLYEEMFTPDENYVRTQHSKILVAANASHFVPASLEESVACLAALAQRKDEEAIIVGLRSLLPEYQPTRLSKPSEKNLLVKIPARPLNNLRLEPAVGN